MEIRETPKPLWHGQSITKYVEVLVMT